MSFAGLKILEGPSVSSGVNELISVIQNGICFLDDRLRGISLSALHSSVTPSELNGLRLALFRLLNETTGEWDQLLDRIAGRSLKSILGPDLLIQTKLNLSIQIPNDSSSVLDLHSDCWSGDSPFQINLWIPLTEAFSTNSMFVFSEAKSFDCIDSLGRDKLLPSSYTNSLIKAEDFLTLSVGQVLVFNPGLIHGNVVNTTASTRISLNVRFKGLFSPGPYDGHPSRGVGPYFRIFALSDWTKLAMKIDQRNAAAVSLRGES